MRERKPPLRGLLIFFVALLLGLVGPLTLRSHDAWASVSFALPLSDLARASSVIARVTPVEASSRWEGGRIVTTTRARVDAIVAGSAPSSEVRIRTLGGIVGDIGQVVEGEAALARGAPALVFLRQRPGEPRFDVAGRAQGELTVADAGGHEIVRVGRVGELLRRAPRPPLRSGRLAIELDGLTFADATREAAGAWEESHAR
jgi:hypothetical protein